MVDSYLGTFPHTTVSYENVSLKALREAKEFLESGEERTQIVLRDLYDSLMNSFRDRYIRMDIAYGALQNGRQIENYNNWYSADDWSRFQQRLDDLEKSFEGQEVVGLFNEDLDMKAVSDAFYALMDAYNRMTNKNALKGDINGDGQVSIADVTLIQKYLAESEKLTGGQIMRAKLTAVDELVSQFGYEKITIDDATALQNFLADNISEFPDNNVFINEIESRFSDDYLMSHFINFTLCPREEGYHTYFDIGIGYYVGMETDVYQKSVDEDRESRQKNN